MARGDGKSGKTVKDVKNGKAVDDHQVPIEGKTEGDNSFVPSGETLNEYLDECIRLYDENKALDDKIRTKCEPERAAKKKNRKHIETMEKKLAGDNYNLAALQAHKRKRIKQHEADLVAKELDEGQTRAFKRMEAATKEFLAIPGGLGGAPADGGHSQPVH